MMNSALDATSAVAEVVAETSRLLPALAVDVEPVLERRLSLSAS
jgi:hypothetical protein